MYLISLINSIRVSSTDGMRRDGSVPIYSAILRKLKPNYNQYMKYLFDNSIIELTKSYDYNKHTSNYYNYTSKYINSSLIEKDINNRVYKSKQKYLEAILTKNIDQISNKSGKTVFKESYKKQNEFLRHLHLEGDYESELRKSTKFKYQINKSKLETINSLKNLDIDLITHRDSSSFRFHSPLTRLKKDFRKYLRFDGDILGQVDIKNSQPFFMLALFDKKFWVNDNPIITRFLDSSIARTNKESLSKIEVYKALNNLKKDEIAKYSKSVVEGRYYEDIVQEIRTNYPDTFIGEPDRELAKALFLNSFFHIIGTIH
ncbi:MAG: hypothetical protein IPI19_16880 [Ignavibacteriales bacterium]|nr:hypothetical protein [Ignavibacteriales bacterium]